MAAILPGLPEAQATGRDSFTCSRHVSSGRTTGTAISVYALEKNKMVNGDPNARAVQFFIDATKRSGAAATRR